MKTIKVVAVTSRRFVEHNEAIRRTQAALPLLSRGHLIQRDPWTLKDFNRFMVEQLAEHLQEDVAITVHWDGHAINRDRWTDEFLDYDYIGAPWPNWIERKHRVGNGAMSLRSRAWLERARQLGNPHGHTEDYYQLVTNRRWFDGLKIAPIELALRFSCENPMSDYPGHKLSDSWGFHDYTFPGTEAHRIGKATLKEWARAVARRCNNRIRNIITP